MQEPFPSTSRSVAVQSVVGGASSSRLERMLGALDNSARVGKVELACHRLVVLLGDAAPAPVLAEDHLQGLRDRFTHIDEIRHVMLDEPLGMARGHNALAAMGDTDFIVTSDAGAVPDARALWRLLGTFDEPTTGMAEAKQLPHEQSKAYDAGTGHTSWASSAFAMTPRSLFEKVGGFDEHTFVEHCADVDYSWMVREAGCTVVFQPAAIVFNDKALIERAGSERMSAEQVSAALAGLLLAHKWSREDVLDQLLAEYDTSPESAHHEAAGAFRERRDQGLLVPQRDSGHEIGYFRDGVYAEHRYE